MLYSKIPERQLSIVDEFIQKYPTGQRTGTEEPAIQKVPEGQTSQIVPMDENIPAAQMTQSVFLAGIHVSAEKDPVAYQ